MKSTKMKFVAMTLVGILGAGLLTGCGASAGNQSDNSAVTDKLSGTVTASGSSALLPLAKQAAVNFMELHDSVTINVTGGGSGTGIRNVADGTSDIGNSDVAFGPEYKDSGIVDHIVAIAPFALIVHKDVAVDSLTKQQAAEIFAGQITNWQDVGGKDQKITVITRPESSGSRKLIVNLILDGKDFAKDGITQAESGAMKRAVAETPGSIGYIDIPYVDSTVKALQFTGVAYSPDAIKSGKYPLYGVEHMYTKGEPTGAVKAFLDYVVSEEFQSTRVEQLKFLPAAFLQG